VKALLKGGDLQAKKKIEQKEQEGSHERKRENNTAKKRIEKSKRLKIADEAR